MTTKTDFVRLDVTFPKIIEQFFVECPSEWSNKLKHDYALLRVSLQVASHNKFSVKNHYPTANGSIKEASMPYRELKTEFFGVVPPPETTEIVKGVNVIVADIKIGWTKYPILYNCNINIMSHTNDTLTMQCHINFPEMSVLFGDIVILTVLSPDNKITFTVKPVTGIHASLGELFITNEVYAKSLIERFEQFSKEVAARLNKVIDTKLAKTK